MLGVRDRALLLVGFAGAFRRSELVSLNVRDLKFTNDGLTVTLRRSKTDQEGSGRKVGIPYGSSPETCPVRSLRAWLEASGIESGPVFRPINRLWSDSAQSPFGPGGGVDCEKGGGGGWQGPCRVCRAQLEVRVGYGSGDRRGFGKGDYEADRASVDGDGEAVYSGRELV